MPDSPILPSKRPAAHAKRLAWALKAHGHLLTAALRKDTSPEARQVEKLPEEQIPEHVGRIILERADPTMAKTMTGWLVRQYAQGGLRLEDTGTANETLTMFQRYAPKLPEGQRDLGKYQSLAEAWQMVFPLAEAEQNKLSGKAQRALDRDKAYAESRILRQDEDGFTIAVPLTEFAAKWWGRGTRWCTAAEKENQFFYYHWQAPLIVVVIPELKEKGKFQIWATEDDVQFMDAADEEVTKTLITEYFYRFDLFVSFLLRKHGLTLGNLPKKLRTVELCRMAVVQNGEALRDVPQKLRTEEICRIAVTQNGGALYFVPKHLRTEEMCRIAVVQDGRALEYVPQTLRTEKICRLALTQDGMALEHVPQKLRTDEMCRVAVAEYGGALEYVPEPLRTEEMFRIAVAQDGRALGWVPENLRTEDMCTIAVAQNGWALKYVPEDLRRDGMSENALAQNGNALCHLPERLRTDEMCSIAVAQDGEALGYGPLERRTDELCRIAVAKNGTALEFVPERLRTDEICRIAVAQYGGAFPFVPQNLRDRMQALIPLPVPTWDVSLLEELGTFLGTASPSAPSRPLHA